MNDNGFLSISINVENQEYYKDIKITGCRVDTPLTFNTDYPYHKVETSGPTTSLHTGAPLPKEEEQLLIVTPTFEGVISPNAPCGKDEPNLGVIYNKEYIAKKGLAYLKDLGDDCSIPRGLIDHIIRAKALDMAIETCNYNAAVTYWKLFTKSKAATSGGCGCYGKK